MIACEVTIDPAFTIAPVPRRLFGSFVEHMGRCVYGGVYEPGHPRADEHGFRQDVIELTRELGVSVVRYPGGNFVSGYRWEDGVGPQEERLPRLDLAWRSLEPNTFGLNEFMRWAGLAGVEPMLAVNLGTRGVEDACNLLEYTNFAGGTRYSDLRIAHGSREPHNVRLWCLGNEMDAPWQLGQKTATEYGRLAAQTAKAMRMIDPDLELVACGSSNERMPTFGSWEAEVLEHCYEHVDYISLHAYFERQADNHAGFLASAHTMDAFIDGVVATVDHVRAKKGATKRLKLSFDEWNVGHERGSQDQAPAEWIVGPRLVEAEYGSLHAVVLGNLLMTLLRHADRVGVACLAQLVNVIAPIRTEPDRDAWRQSIFHPFALTASRARGDVLRLEPRSPRLDIKEHGDVPAVDVLATRDAAADALTLYAVNRHQTAAASLDARLVEFGDHHVIEHLVIDGSGPMPASHAGRRDAVMPQASAQHELTAGHLQVRLPAASWTMLTIARTPT
jgi:alpha-N-arabinofuranosidase